MDINLLIKRHYQKTPLPNTNDFEKNNANWRIQLVPQVSKGTICTVTKAIALWVPEERRTSSFTNWKMANFFQEKMCLCLLGRLMLNIFMGLK